MSKIENPKIVSKKTLFFGCSDDNALETQKVAFFSVMIKFSIFFCKNSLGIFVLSIYTTNDNKLSPKNPQIFMQ
jgi:hypothetical protein